MQYLYILFRWLLRYAWRTLLSGVQIPHPNTEYRSWSRKRDPATVEGCTWILNVECGKHAQVYMLSSFALKNEISWGSRDDISCLHLSSQVYEGAGSVAFLCPLQGRGRCVQISLCSQSLNVESHAVSSRSIVAWPIAEDISCRKVTIQCPHFLHIIVWVWCLVRLQMFKFFIPNKLLWKLAYSKSTVHEQIFKYAKEGQQKLDKSQQGSL